MLSINLICIVVALVFFALAAFTVPSGRFNLTAAGLFFFALAGVVR